MDSGKKAEIARIDWHVGSTKIIIINYDKSLSGKLPGKGGEN